MKQKAKFHINDFMIIINDKKKPAFIWKYCTFALLLAGSSLVSFKI